MAHYAFLDENNIVTEVITGIDETELIEGLDTETWYGNFRGQACKRTSYHGNIRKNYAGIGFTYDELRDAFVAPKPYPSWILDEATCCWQAPISMPTDGAMYSWNEETLAWEVPLTQAEIDQREVDATNAEAAKAEADAIAATEADAKASAQAKLAALGLTAEEIAALSK